jgi:hypothetical protein
MRGERRVDQVLALEELVGRHEDAQDEVKPDQSAATGTDPPAAT